MNSIISLFSAKKTIKIALPVSNVIKIKFKLLINLTMKRLYLSFILTNVFISKALKNLNISLIKQKLILMSYFKAISESRSIKYTTMYVTFEGQI